MKTLRQLAKEYAHGQLKQAEYRQYRAELIQGILDGKVEVHDRTFEAPLPPPDDDITEQSGFDPFATTQLAAGKLKPPQFDIGDDEATLPEAVANNMAKTEKPRPKPEPQITSPFQRNKLTILFVATVIVLVVAIALTFFMLRSELETESSPDPVVTQVQPVSESPAADKLIKDFLTTNNWQTENLDRFLVQWQQLDQEERTKSLQSTRINQLGSAIYKKILEEKALMSIGDADTTKNKQQVLINFARAIGIKDPKITSP